ncbi:Spermidine synthase [Minicystis rosea]|nr:Spermidine synthase [Minicystis rosea]
MIVGSFEDRRNLAILFVSGLGLMLLDYVLVRQLAASFADLETSAILMTLGYFAGVSLGYFRPERVTPERIRIALPFLLVLQLVLVVVGPFLVRALAERAGETAAYAVTVAVIALGTTSLYSVFLPALIASDESRAGRYYAAEVLGSITGILLLFGLARAGMPWIQAAYLVAFVAVAALAGARVPILAAMTAIAVTFPIASPWLDRKVAAMTYASWLTEGRPVSILWSRHSPYHKVEVIEARESGRMLLLDGQVHFASSWRDAYDYYAAEYPARLLGRPQVAVLGCGSMATIGRMGEHATSIRIVDIDEGVFEASRAFFGDVNHLDALHNWTFEADDAKHFLGTTSEVFDLVVDDIPPARTRQVALTYTREFFRLVRARLGPRGVFSLPTLVPVTSTRRAYGRRILATLADVFDHVYVLTTGGTSYLFAAGLSLSLDEDTLRRAIDRPERDAVHILLPDAARDLVRGLAPITQDNTADLIDE